MNLEHINHSFKRSIEDNEYINYDNYKLLNEGKADIVFADDIVKQIKLKFGNYMIENDFYRGWDVSEGKVIPRGEKVDLIPLISNNSIHKSQARVVKNLCFAEVPKITSDMEEVFNRINNIDNFTDKLITGIKTTNYSGTVLYKPVYDVETQDITVDLVSIRNYFPVFSKANKCIKIAYVEYTCVHEEKEDNKKIYRVVIHERGKNTTMFCTLENNNFKAIEAENSMKMFSESIEGVEDLEFNKDFEINLSDGKLVSEDETVKHVREFKRQDKFDVAEAFAEPSVGKVYSESAYSNASLKYTKNWILTDTIQKQGLQSLLKPKLAIDSTFLTRNLVTGENEINVEKDVFISDKKAFENGQVLFQQIPIDLKTSEITEILTNDNNGAKRELGLTDALLGEATNGGLSGTAKELDLIPMLSHCEVIRNNNYQTLKSVLDFAVMEVYNQEFNFTVTWGELIPATETERINEAVIKLNNTLDTEENILKELLKKDDVSEILALRQEKKKEELQKSQNNSTIN